MDQSKTRRSILLGLLGAAIFAPRALAHGDHLHGPLLMVLETRRAPEGDRIAVDLEVFNGFGVAATLRSLSSSIATRVSIERRRSVLGQKIWQPVSFLRLEPDEALVIGRPDYRLILHGVDAPLDQIVKFDLRADFGPLGELSTSTLAFPVKRPAAQTTE